MKTMRYKLFAIGCAICVVILIVLNSWPKKNIPRYTKGIEMINTKSGQVNLISFDSVYERPCYGIEDLNNGWAIRISGERIDPNSIADLVVITERDPWKAVVRNYTPTAWITGYDSLGHTLWKQITSVKIDLDTIPYNQIKWLTVEDTIINTITYAYHEKRNYPKVRKGYHKCPVNNPVSDFDDGLEQGIKSLLHLKSWYNNDSTSDGGTGIDINNFLGGNNSKHY